MKRIHCNSHQTKFKRAIWGAFSCRMMVSSTCLEWKLLIISVKIPTSLKGRTSPNISLINSKTPNWSTASWKFLPMTSSRWSRFMKIKWGNSCSSNTSKIARENQRKTSRSGISPFLRVLWTPQQIKPKEFKVPRQTRIRKIKTPRVLANHWRRWNLKRRMATRIKWEQDLAWTRFSQSSSKYSWRRMRASMRSHSNSSLNFSYRVNAVPPQSMTPTTSLQPAETAAILKSWTMSLLMRRQTQ